MGCSGSKPSEVASSEKVAGAKDFVTSTVKNTFVPPKELQGFFKHPGQEALVANPQVMFQC